MIGLTTSVAIASTPSSTIEYKAVEPPRAVEMIQIKQGSAETTPVAAIIHDMAKQYGINFNDFYNTLYCESYLVPQQSKVPDPKGPNGREDSWGVPQIHLPSHPDVTKDQAMNNAWSIEWAAKQFAKDPTIWTCYRLLKGL